MQARVLAEGEYYHIYTRGVRKQDIFHDERDYVRFLFLLLHFQGEYAPTNITKSVNGFVRTGVFPTSPATIRTILAGRIVAPCFFSLMPNHIHLCLEQIEGSGISKYMHRVLLAYAKYYNEKYKVTGHLFQSKFGRVLVEDNDQLPYLSSYIHRNQREIVGWRDREHEYPWSSYKDYIGDNRWGSLLSTGIILGQFDDKKDYSIFVRKSPAKVSKSLGMDI